MWKSFVPRGTFRSGFVCGCARSGQANVPRGTLGGRRSNATHRSVNTSLVVDLAVQTNQGDHGENYRAEEDLSNVIVEDLLVRVRGIDGVGFFLVRFDVEERIDWIGYVLFDVHVVAPLLRHRTFPCVLCIHGGVPSFLRAEVFITKVHLLFNYFFAKICGFLAKRRANGAAYGVITLPKMLITGEKSAAQLILALRLPNCCR
jgi:hypothetical protein